MYDADVSPSLISKVTDSVSEQVIGWQNRPLNELYPIIYLDCIVVKIRQDSQVINKSVHIVDIEQLNFLINLICYASN